MAKPSSTRRTAATGRTTGADLVRQLRQAQHRAAVLDQAAVEVMAMFLGDDDAPPRYLVGSDTSAELADGDTVLRVSSALKKQADEARVIVAKLLAASVSGVRPSPDSRRLYAEPGSPHEAVGNIGFRQVVISSELEPDVNRILHPRKLEE